MLFNNLKKRRFGCQKKRWTEEFEKKVLASIADDLEIDSGDIQNAVEKIGLTNIIDEIYRDDLEFKTKVKERVKKLFLDQLDEIDNFDELTGGSDYLSEYLPEDFIKNTIQEIINEDEETRDETTENLKTFFQEALSNLDFGKLMDWDDFLKSTKIKERLADILKEEKTSQKLTERLQQLVDEQIANNLDCNELPDDFIEQLLSLLSAESLLADPEFKQSTFRSFSNALSAVLADGLKDRSSGLREKIRSSKTVSVLNAIIVDEWSADPKIQSELLITFRESALQKEDFFRMMLSGFTEEMGRMLFSRLFDKTRF